MFDPASSLHSAAEAVITPQSDSELLDRARAFHLTVDFDALAAGPRLGGPWRRIEATDHFVVFKRPSSAKATGSRIPGREVLCAGRLDASIEEVESILWSSSDGDLVCSMQGLYAKSFIFGSIERDVPCSNEQQNDENENADTSEQLNIKTSSFVRSTLFSRNEQWCFTDFFQRKQTRDGFTISQRALSPMESTPGRVVGRHARVDQLHGLNASYVVEQLPERQGLRVVYNAWFEDFMTEATRSDTTMSDCNTLRRRSSGMSDVSNSSASSRRSDNMTRSKAQQRRLLSLAHGLTNLPELIRRRRFGLQMPVDFETVQTTNSRCPCCTHSLAPVKLSIFMAASVIAKRSLRSFKMDTRRCYLCGYLVCIDCWSAEYMESTVGRVAAIVVCTRCHANVQSCEYSEVCSPDQGRNQCGPVKVVNDPLDNSAASLLIDFLQASLMNESAGCADRAAVLSVIRMLLQQSEERTSDDDGDGSDYDDFEHVTVEELDRFLNDKEQLPDLSSCVLANAERREYLIELPVDPTTMVPSAVIPSHDNARLQLADDKGLLLLAQQLAPLDSSANSIDKVCDVRDLNLLCQLAVRASGCSDAFVTVMGVEHNHILAATHAQFQHAVVPREQTVCQHTIMTTKPFVVTHLEADVRFHEMEAVKALSIRFYVGFPVTMCMLDDRGNETEISVGTLCCIDSTARAELTRAQYTTMKRLTNTASKLIQLKARQLQAQVD